MRSWWTQGTNENGCVCYCTVKCDVGQEVKYSNCSCKDKPESSTNPDTGSGSGTGSTSGPLEPGIPPNENEDYNDFHFLLELIIQIS